MDVAIYETFARMSQPWINNIPEVDWHGNNGSQYTGPDCAASRYTEARLSKATELGMFDGIKKHNVKMILNYSEDAEWPEVLPAIFPRLMVNGCQGIGSTIANTWLPHSLSDVSNVILSYLDDNTIDTNNLYPSFPTGGIIINKDDIHTIYETGKGKVILRGKAEIKDNKILITELPYQVYVQPFVEKITDMAIKDELSGIEAVYNKSGKDILLIEIDCNDNPQQVLNQLYDKTDFQKNYNANQWALIGKTPKLLTLKDYLDVYINHNIKCICQEAKFDKQKAENRQHIIQGLLIALEDIDNIIALIKQSKDTTKAKQNLIIKYSLDDIQAQAIIDMKLGKLANLEKIELKQENENLINKISELTTLLQSEELQKETFKNKLINFVAQFKDSRKTELIQLNYQKAEKEVQEIAPKNVIVTITKNGNIKKIPSDTFKVQKHGGKGVKNEAEVVLETIYTNTTDQLMLFTSIGKMYRLLVDNIPTGTLTSKGVNINSLISFEYNEKVIAATSLRSTSTPKYIIFITKNGLIKKTLLEEYYKLKRNNTGLIAIKLKDSDSLANVLFMDEEDLILVTKKGMSIHFETQTIAPTGRVTIGVRAIKLQKDDQVIMGLPIHKVSDMLAIVTSQGFGKKCKLSDFILQQRDGKGILINPKGKDKDFVGDVIGIAMVDDNDNILITGSGNSICVSVKEIPLLSRNSQGNKLIKSTALSIAKIK